uniref:Centromere protein N n=1 Tax=Ciona savignyi TaxID=51511 RepID=H2YMR4_CIOSA
MTSLENASLLLSSVLKRTSKHEMRALLTNWGKLPIWKIQFNRPKYEIIQEICTTCEEFEIDVKYALELDLLYITEFPHKKSWKAYKLLQPIGSTLSAEHMEPDSVQRSLQQKLFVAFSCNVTVMEKKFSLWGRVSKPGVAQPLYFIHFPFSKYVLFNKANAKLQSLVEQALRKVLGFRAIEAMSLVSPHPEALAQILLHNSDPNDSYTHDEGHFKAVERNAREPLRECDNRVNICHARKLQREKKYTDHQFGTKLQPSLPSIELKTETRFRGQTYIPEVPRSALIKCKTTMSGPNVLEGLRKLSLLGNAVAPLPRFLTNISKTGQQCLKITDAINDDTSRHSA